MCTSETETSRRLDTVSMATLQQQQQQCVQTRCRNIACLTPNNAGISFSVSHNRFYGAFIHTRTSNEIEPVRCNDEIDTLQKSERFYDFERQISYSLKFVPTVRRTEKRHFTRSWALAIILIFSWTLSDIV